MTIIDRTFDTLYCIPVVWSQYEAVGVDTHDFTVYGSSRCLSATQSPRAELISKVLITKAYLVSTSVTVSQERRSRDYSSVPRCANLW